ncbi:MAG: DUF309 domain-containing protein [Phycisphaeraceae bacterium]
MHPSPEDLDEPALFHEGLHLFNTNEWFEAHEIWEDIWRPASGEKKRFYQGLIQAAVVIEHLRRGNPRGARSVFQSCIPKFDGITGIYMGIDVPLLIRQLTDYIAPVLNLPTSAFDPGRERGQNLPVDLNAAPKIELKYDPFAGESPAEQ